MFFPEVDRDAGVPQRILEAAIVEGRAATEGWRIRKDGSRFWASGIVTPLYDAAGRVRGFGKLIRDDTGRRDQQERQIRHTEQERIAVSLADTVVRRVFAISLHANSAMHLTSDAAARERLELLVQEADETIRFLRSAIFEIGGAPGGPP